MLVWAFWGVAAQRRRPWMATFVAGLMNAYLPFAHTRFIPLSLMAFGFFGLEGLWGASPESWPRRLWRLTMFTLICFTGYAAYYHMQTRMFSTGSSYEIEGTLFSYWPGAWHVFADRRGAVPLTPLLYWMIPAACLWPLKDRTRPFLSAGLVLTFLACVLTSCTNRVSVGGASVQGRYLLVVFPLLAPGTAASLQYVLRSRERFLFMSLAALSALPLFWLLYWVPDTGSVFTQPLGTLAQQPLFQGLFKPYLHREVVYAPAWTNWLAGFFPLLALLAMAIILGWNKRAGWLLLTVALALAVAVHAAVTPARLPARPERVAALLERTNLARARTDRRPGRITRDFFHLARTPYRDFHLHAPYTLLSEPLPDAIPPVFSIHALPLNDWDGRPYRWFTLTAPHPPAPGTWIIHIAGTLEGRARLHFAAKEGRHVLVETEIPQHEGHWRLDQVIEPHGKRGDLYLLLRVEAEDEWACRMKHLYRARFHPRMLAEANLDLHTIPAQHSDQNSNP